MLIPQPVAGPVATVDPVRDAVDDGCALPDGTWLDEFRIVRTLGVGGFGIVYLALDTALEREVAIKEYLPTSIARRREGATVEARTSPPTFAAGLQSFLYEARLLASFDHPSLVKVHRFWEANQTAYMAMRYYPGHTLKDERSRRAAPPDERWLRERDRPAARGARAAARGRRLSPRHLARQHPAAARRHPGAARLRLGAQGDRRPHAGADGNPQAELRAGRAVRRRSRRCVRAPGPTCTRSAPWFTTC